MRHLSPQKAVSAIGPAFLRFIGSDARGTGGATAIEFAILSSVLILLMVCTTDLGMGMYRKLQVQNASQAGAEYAVVSGSFNASAISSAVAHTTTFSDITAAPAPSQFYGCVSNGSISHVTQNSTCPDGMTAGTYVTVSAQGTYKTLLHYPLLPDAFTFVSQSTVRIQ